MQLQLLGKTTFHDVALAPAQHGRKSCIDTLTCELQLANRVFAFAIDLIGIDDRDNLLRLELTLAGAVSGAVGTGQYTR